MEGEYVVAAIAVLFGWDVAQLNCPIKSCDTVGAVADVLLGELMICKLTDEIYYLLFYMIAFVYVDDFTHTCHCPQRHDIV